MGSSDSTWFTRVWQIDDGLLDNKVDQVVQGTDDYLWLVTPVGMMQFDGNSFRLFRMEDFVAPAATHVRMILRSRAGALWMASDGGAIVRLNPDFSAVTLSTTALPAFKPDAWDEAGDGSLWLGYPDAIYRIQSGQVTKLPAKDGAPLGIFHTLRVDGVGNIWLAQGSQFGFFKDGKFRGIGTMQGIGCMGSTHTNAIWFVSDRHLFHCDTNGKLRDCGAFQDSFVVKTTALLEDHARSVWIGTDGNGLFRYNGLGFERIKTSHASVSSLAEDREGNIWAGTGGGLDRITMSGVRLETMQNNQFPSQIQSICEDANGVLWGTTQYGELISRINDRWDLLLTNAPFAGMATCVAAGDGAVWVGTQKGELFCLGNNSNPAGETNIAATYRMQKVPLWQSNTNYTIWRKNMTHFSICGLLPTSKGDLWVVSGGHLQCLHAGQIRNIELPKNIYNHAIVEDASNNIWIGGNGTFISVSGKKLVNRTSCLALSGHPICCLYTTDDDSIWTGSRGGGLVRYKNGHRNWVGLDQGLVDDYISQIVEDKHGWLWFGSNHGIFKIRKEELDRAMKDNRFRVRPIVYGENEGLANIEALYSAATPYVFPRAILDRDGRIWMLTDKGVVVADPSLLSNDSAPPPVLLTQVILDGQIIAAYGGVVSFHTATNLKILNGPLQLPPTHRHLEFDFTAFHFSAPENIHFRYQLVGFDTNWIDAGTERSATYSRLPAGDYHFNVEACIGAGLWSEPPAMLAVTVIPFFWQTWWFRLGVLLLFTSCVIVIARYISIRRIKVQMRLLEQRAALDKERTRIARDLHDDLGCSLNKVALSLDLTQKSKLKNGEIQRFSTMIRDVAQSVDEIVWAINPRNDALRYVVDFISQSAVEFLQAADIPCIIELPDNIPNQMVSPEARHNLLLVVKEALNNVARHARATEVRLSITVAEHQITITIEDNGCGFDSAPDDALSDGLRNMSQRMKEIGGEFQLKSQPGAGTRVVFRYSLAAQTPV